MSDEITTVLLREVPDGERGRLEEQMRRLSVSEAQWPFVLLPQESLSICHRNAHCWAFVARSDGRVVGMGALHRQTSPTEVWPDDGPWVLIRGVLVDEGWQGRGVGQAMMSDALRLVPEPMDAVLTVHRDNVAAQQLYERLGFTFTGRWWAGRSGPERVLALRSER